MDILRRNLAPISTEAWEEIDNEAKKAFTKLLTGRKVVVVDGPKGFDFSAVNLGKLDEKDIKEKDGIAYGVKKTQPLTELRTSFKLNIWELDNFARGAEDVDLDPLVEAAHKLARFEDNAIFYGLDVGCIKGLKDSSGQNKLKMPTNYGEAIMKVGEAVEMMSNEVVSEPYNLIVNSALWRKLASESKGFPLRNQLENFLQGGKVVLSTKIDKAFLIAENEDVKMTLGQDLSIGYQAHDNKEVELYFTESFTFQVIDPAAVIVFE